MPFSVLWTTMNTHQFEDHNEWSAQTMAGVEHALIGMKVGGYRKVRISLHLAYRDKGITDLVSSRRSIDL